MNSDNDSAVSDNTPPAPQQQPAPVRSPADLDWWARPVARWVALLVVSGVVAYLLWLMLAPFVDVVMWAVVLVVVFQPVHRRLVARTRSPSTAAVLSCLLVIVVILLPLALVTAAVVRDAANVAQALQDRKNELLDPTAQTAVGRALRWVDRFVDIDRLQSHEYLAERARAVSGTVARRTLNLVGGLVGAVVQMFFVIFTMFYLFRDGPRLRSRLRDLLPLDRWQSHEVFLRTKEVIQASVYGSLVIATIQGVLGGLAFWVLDVPSPLLWGAVMILLCMIPMAGAFLVWVPAALYLLAGGHPWNALFLAVWGGVVIGSIDNVLRPRLVGGRTRMHELVVFFAVLGGLQVFGVLGIVTGPALAAIAMALFEIWRRSKTPAPGAAPVAEPAVGAPVTIAPTAAPAAVAPGSRALPAEVHPTGTRRPGAASPGASTADQQDANRAATLGSAPIRGQAVIGSGPPASSQGGKRRRKRRRK